jgi:hypothetical protein
MRSILDALGIDNTTSKDHYNHFHITLQAPERRAIADSINLLSNNDSEKEPSWVEAVKADWLPHFDFNPEQEITMFFPDTPPQIPDTNEAIVVVQQDGLNYQPDHIGVCLLTRPYDERYDFTNVVFDPPMRLYDHITDIEGTFPKSFSYNQTLLLGPEHGDLEPIPNSVLGGGIGILLMKALPAWTRLFF